MQHASIYFFEKVSSDTLILLLHFSPIFYFQLLLDSLFPHKYFPSHPYYYFTILSLKCNSKNHHQIPTSTSPNFFQHPPHLQSVAQAPPQSVDWHVARNDFCGCSGRRIFELLIRVSKDTGLGCGCHVAQNYFVLCSEFRI